MKTSSYNPSPLEKAIAETLSNLQDQIVAGLSGQTLESLSVNASKDNPEVHLTTKDADGDQHEFVITVIQRPDR
jgi:hypothetical protein